MASLKLSEYRPCKVNKHKAVFHRWVEKENLVLQSDTMVDSKSLESITKAMKDSQNGKIPIPYYFKAAIIHNTYGLVEYPSGRVHLVEPETIKFLDSKATAYEAGFKEDRNEKA